MVHLKIRRIRPLITWFNDQMVLLQLLLKATLNMSDSSKSEIRKVLLQTQIHKIFQKYLRCYCKMNLRTVNNNNKMVVDLQCQGRAKADVICCKILTSPSLKCFKMWVRRCFQLLTDTVDSRLRVTSLNRRALRLSLSYHRQIS